MNKIILPTKFDELSYSYLNYLIQLNLNVSIYYKILSTIHIIYDNLYSPY